MPDAFASPATERHTSQINLWVAGLYFFTLLLVFHETSWSMVSIWLRSETFSHGFLILPISSWLIWNQRDRLSSIPPKSNLWLALLMLPAGFAWLLAWLVDVQVVQQLALVSMLIIGVWTILGHRLASAMAFPLFFLFFAVPMGEALIPPMMEFTASSTVWLIQLTGIPVYREGMYFSLPSGNWSVVEACSGVRYIIAAVTLGVLYAYLTYDSFQKRFLFVLASAIVPVFANALRAYLIVILGHLSSMKIATGVDHLIYGWVFFGFVIFLLFWLGSFFRDDRVASPEGMSRRFDEGSSSTGWNSIVAMLVALLAAAVWPLLANTTEFTPNSNLQRTVTLPAGNSGWRVAPQPDWQWQPVGVVAGKAAAYYTLNEKTLGLFIQYPDGSATDKEIVGSSTQFSAKDGDVRVVGREKVLVEFGDESVLVDEVQLKGLDMQLLAWSWYRIGDIKTSNDYFAKLSEALTRIGYGSAGSYRIVVASPLDSSNLSTRARLQNFLDEHGRQLDHALIQAPEAGQ